MTVKTPPKKDNLKLKKETPVSGGRREGLRVPEEGDILLEEEGLADVKRLLFTPRLEGGFLAVTASATASSRLYSAMKKILIINS